TKDIDFILEFIFLVHLIMNLTILIHLLYVKFLVLSLCQTIDVLASIIKNL
ncbi:hypothetical protein RhiirB3_412717, partial [Rhizophagus irregularis]